MAGKRKVPEIRFKGFDGEWEEKEFAQIINLQSGKDYKHLQTGNIPVYGTGGYMLSVDAALSFDDAIGIGRKGTIDKPFILNAPFWTVDTLFFAVPKDTIDHYFVFGLFQKIDWKKKDESTGVPSLSKSIINSIELYTPESSEQIVIGEMLKNLDNLITLHQQKHDKLVAVKKSMLEKMFPRDCADVPEVRFQGFTGKWERRTLGEVISYIVDNRGKNPDYYCKEGIPVIDNIMIKNKCYPNLKEATRFIDNYLFINFIRKYNEVDDILITLVGNGIGNITLFPKEKSVIIQNTLGLRFFTNKIFMFYIMLSKNKQIVMLDRGMAQPSIRQDELLKLEIKLPSDLEQEQIGYYFQNLDNLINHQSQKLDKLKAIKKACLEKLFVG